MGFLDRQARARPSLVLAFSLIPSVYFPGLWPWAVLVFAGAGAVLVWRHSSLVPLVLAAAALCLFWGLRAAPDPPPRWPFEVKGLISGEGTVIAEAPVNRKGNTLFRFRIETVQKEEQEEEWAGRASASVTVLGWREVSPPTGSRWAFTGMITDTGDALVWKSGHPLDGTAPWWQVRAQVRQGLQRTLERLGPAPAALAEALLIGAVDDLTPWEKDSFRLAGCSHVLALSGMHLSLLALGLHWLLHRRVSPWVVFLGTQIVLGLFCFLAGPIPSLLRAWVMVALAGIWTLWRKPVPLRELLAQSFIVSVLLWPSLAGSLSLQLSFLAMAGLFWWSQRWDRALRPFLGRWAAANLAASAAALAATVPLTLVLFGEVRWVGLLLTPPLVFLTTIHLFGAAAVGVLGLVPGFDAAFLAPAFQLLYDLTFAVTAWGSGFPAVPLGPVVGIGLGGLGVGALFLYNDHRRASLPVSLNYDSPVALQAFLSEQGYNALKRWGQNFLINAGARRQILAALELAAGEPVWEVGPGLGALTHHLVAENHPVKVFEIDPGYARFLREEFGSAPGFEVVEGDVIKTWKSQPRTGVKTVGNLPYNAASAIVADFIEGGFFPSVFVVTVQLEMAQRMTATPGTKNYSSFSILCQSVFQLTDVVTLKPGSFYPAPEVTSRVVKLKPHGRYPELDHVRFSRFVRECFSSRRKTLRNNLPGAAAALKITDEVVLAAFANERIDLGLRAEVLTVEQFVKVFQALG